MIAKFKGAYAFLSNFEPVWVELEGIRYKSVEHAYQAAKSLDPKWRKYCKQEESAGKVKKQSRKISWRDDWQVVIVEVMRDLLVQKFNQEPFRSLLLETGQVYIIEGNVWHDTFWGVDLRTGEGKNILGHLLMEIREELSED